MHIEKAQKQDLAAILELQKRCYRENAERYHDDHIPPMTQSLSELEQDYDHYLILKALGDENKIIGSVRAYREHDICHIERLFVRPDYQNQGLGKELMLAMEQQFSDVKAYQLYTGHKDEKNMHLYQNLGYRKIGEEVHSTSLTFVFFEKSNQA